MSDTPSSDPLSPVNASQDPSPSTPPPPAAPQFRQPKDVLDELKKKLQPVVKEVVPLISGAVIVGVLVSWLSSIFDSQPPPPPWTKDISRLESQIAVIKKDLDGLVAGQQALKGINSDTELAKEVASLASSREKLSSSVTRLEQAISDDPERALSVPLMRKDISLLKDSVASVEAAAHRDVERMHSLTIWFLGTMLTVGVAILGLILKRRQPRTE